MYDSPSAVVVATAGHVLAVAVEHGGEVVCTIFTISELDWAEMLLALSVSMRFVMISARTLCGQVQLCRLGAFSAAITADEFATEPPVSSLSVQHARLELVLTLHQYFAASTRPTQAMAAPAVQANVQ